MPKHIFTEEDIISCWAFYLSYFVDLLNEETTLLEVQENLLSLIQSKWDNRVIRRNENK